MTGFCCFSGGALATQAPGARISSQAPAASDSLGTLLCSCSALSPQCPSADLIPKSSSPWLLPPQPDSLSCVPGGGRSGGGAVDHILNPSCLCPTRVLVSCAYQHSPLPVGPGLLVWHEKCDAQHATQRQRESGLLVVAREADPTPITARCIHFLLRPPSDSRAHFDFYRVCPPPRVSFHRRVR